MQHHTDLTSEQKAEILARFHWDYWVKMGLMDLVEASRHARKGGVYFVTPLEDLHAIWTKHHPPDAS